MTDRLQLNLRLDGRRDLLESIKEIAGAQGLSLNTYVIKLLEQAARNETPAPAAVTKNSQISDIEPIVVKMLDNKLDTILDNKLVAKLAAIEERLGKLSA